MSSIPDLSVTRVRHPLKFRLLEATRVQALTPHLIRVTFTGEDLSDFESASFDDHIKVFFPTGSEPLVMPTMGPDGLVFPAGPRPVARDFTPRRFDRAARELDIEFAIHEAGPAATWAKQAQVGQSLGVGGPRGSLVIPTGFDWQVLIGDDTALPAIARRLSELPAGTRVTAILEVADVSGHIEFETQADLTAIWCYRSASVFESNALLQAARELELLAGEGYVWAAGEASAMRAIRDHFRTERGMDKSRLRIASYWKHGDAAVHENLED